MNTKDIDRTHILALKEVHGTFQKIEIPIENPEMFMSELSAMVENPNRTVWDMQSHFQSRYPKNMNGIDYIYPYSYQSTYVSGASYPPIMTYAELSSSWNNVANDICDTYNKKCLENNITPNEAELKQMQEKAIAEKKKVQKQQFLSSAVRWISAYCYTEASKLVQRESAVKMYSKENIGWNTFRYNVNGDIKVELGTNFGFGSAAYFLLAIRYKGIAILPYSYIVKYYKANMADIIRCTRSYVPDRESWEASFDFLVDFINESNSDPENFIRTYIMHEVNEMMSGLEAIATNPKLYMETIGNKTADPCIINVRQMLGDERRKMASYPEETPILFKVEKITGALQFLNSLTEIGKVVNEVQQHVDRLIELNFALCPEIEKALININEKINKHNITKLELTQKLESIISLLAHFEEEIQKLREQSTEEKQFQPNEYMESHPIYKELSLKKNELKSQIYSIDRLISDFSSFANMLNNSLSLLEEMREKEAA